MNLSIIWAKSGGIINNVSHIEIVVVLRYHQQRVSLVVVVIAVFHSEIIDGVYIKGQFVKTAVAKERQHTRQMKPEFIAFGTVVHGMTALFFFVDTLGFDNEKC